MKVVQPFILGGVSGLALSLAIAIGLFLSPIRRTLYLEWDPELARLRSLTDQIRERMLAGEMRLAEGASAAAGAAAPAGQDSLRTAQAGAWKEYKHWRNRLGELSRAHVKAEPAAFPAWAYSLRYGLGPLAALLSLVPALFFAVRSARRPLRPSRSAKAPAKAPPRPQPAPEAAITSFQSAVKEVARIATPLPPAARPVADSRPARSRPVAGAQVASDIRLGSETRFEAPPTVPGELSPEPSPYDAASDTLFREAEAGSPSGAGSPARPEALETQIIQLGPGGWGEPRLSPEAADPSSRIGAGDPVAGDAAGNAGALSMEDEDGPGPSVGDAATGGEDAGARGHFMPPTTEVERVERRKAEVLKLARKGMTSSEISRRLRISQDQVEFIIRLRREKG